MDLGWNRSHIYLTATASEVNAVKDAMAAAMVLVSEAMIVRDGAKTVIGLKANQDKTPQVLTLGDVTSLADSLDAQASALENKVDAMMAAWMGLISADVAKAVSDARASLPEAMASAQSVLDSSSGKVLRESTRTVLREALDAAQKLADTPDVEGNLMTHPAGVYAMWSLKDSIDEAVESLAVASKAVTDSQSAWQKKQ